MTESDWEKQLDLSKPSKWRKGDTETFNHLFTAIQIGICNSRDDHKEDSLEEYSKFLKDIESEKEYLATYIMGLIEMHVASATSQGAREERQRIFNEFKRISEKNSDHVNKITYVDNWFEDATEFISTLYPSKEVDKV